MLFKAGGFQVVKFRRERVTKNSSVTIAARSQLNQTDAQARVGALISSHSGDEITPVSPGRAHTHTRTVDGYFAEEAVGGTSNRQTHDAPQKAEWTSAWTEHHCSTRHGRGTM